MWRHYVYIHRKADSGEPFYVGKGSERKRNKTARFDRARSVSSRSGWWRSIVNKHGLFVDVFAMFQSDADAQKFEIDTIRDIGRKNIGLGPLINLTDGGDGHAGIVTSDILRARRSELGKRPRSQKWVKSMRKSRKNGGNGGVVRRGDTLPESWRRAIANGKVGSRNPMFGKTGTKHPQSRPVIDNSTGTTFESITAAASFLGIKMQTLHNMLIGRRPNNSTMSLV